MRDYRIDNAKGVLIAFVVLGHFLIAAGGWEDPVLSALLLFVQPFHMPGFVFLAGATTNRKNLGRRLAVLTVFLIVFQAAYAIPIILATGKYPNGPLQPYFHLWFLLSLMCWTAATPLIRKVPAPLLVSTIIAFGAGLIPWAGYDLSISRTIVFLPFFVAGHLYGGSFLEWVRDLGRTGGRYSLIRSVLLIAMIGIAVVNYVNHVPFVLFYGAANYRDLGVGPLIGIAARAYHLGLAAFSVAAVIIIVGDRRTWLTKVGAASLSVYLLHMFVTVVCIKLKILHPVFLHRFGPAATFAVATALTCAAVLVFSMPIFDRAVRRLPDVLRQPFSMPRRRPADEALPVLAGYAASALAHSEALSAPLERELAREEPAPSF